jgi:hypothetical protein
MQQRLLFDGWLNYINPTYNYNMRYKENYATTLTINQYNVSNEKKMIIIQKTIMKVINKKVKIK